MGKQNTKRKGRLQTVLDREQTERDTAPLVNPFAEQHGDYVRNLRFMQNRGGTALARWITAKLLSDSQQAAILHCINLWAKIGSRSIVANLQRSVGGGYGDGYAEAEALAELHRIKSGIPEIYWNVFERVCRWDEPAGVAGSRLCRAKNSADVAARVTVCFVADLIATRERLSY
jgi:hypothetical protein